VLRGARATFAARARTFWWAARLLPPAARDDAAVVYALCRLADDTADEATDPAAARAALDRLADEVTGRAPARPVIAAFRETAARLEIPLESALELVEGVRSDLGTVRLADDDELVRYGYRVAGTVGLMMCAVLGVRRREALPHAVDLGIAMQLTNICRDVAEDAARGRVYLPARRLRAAGTGPEALVRGEAPPAAVVRVVGEVLELAGGYYRSADRGMRDIPICFRPAILVASRVYSAIGSRLRRRPCDVMAGRAVVSGPEKLLRGCAAVAEILRPEIAGLSPRTAHDPGLHRALRGFPGTHA
jgi:phytoene synthase